METSDGKTYVLKKGDGLGDTSPTQGTVVTKKKIRQVSDNTKNED